MGDKRKTVRLLMFILGAALAAGTTTESMRRFAEKTPDAAVLLVYIAANLLFVADQNWYRFIPVYLVTSAALVFQIVHGRGFLHKLFSLGPLCRLGRISYSFYLFHGLAIVAFCDHIGPHLKALPEGARFVALLAGSFALSVLAAAATAPASRRRQRFGVTLSAACASRFAAVIAQR